jgi:hypothetical protein
MRRVRGRRLEDERSDIGIGQMESRWGGREVGRVNHELSSRTV